MGAMRDGHMQNIPPKKPPGDMIVNTRSEPIKAAPVVKALRESGNRICFSAAKSAAPRCASLRSPAAVRWISGRSPCR